MRIWADFNAVNGEMIWTSLNQSRIQGRDDPQVGERVEFYDHEGNHCVGRVTSVEGPIVYARLELDTWRDGSEETGA